MAVSIQNITPLALSWYAPMIAAAALVLAYEARGAEDVVVDAQLQGNALAISAHATIRAPLSAIWHTLIDYDHLTEFIPGMKMSRVLQRRGGTVVVEQVGDARLLMFHYPIDVVVQSNEHYLATIAVHLLSSNLRQLAGGYRIETVARMSNQFVLRWQGIIEPDIPLPLFITAPGLRNTLMDQFVGMVKEIERRGTLQAVSRPQ